MATRRDDDDSDYEGHGIHQEDGKDFIVSQLDNKALKQFGFRTDKGFTSREKVDCNYTEKGTPLNELLASAREGSKPLMGRGTPEDEIQTGNRKWKGGPR